LPWTRVKKLHAILSRKYEETLPTTKAVSADREKKKKKKLLI
jgi:hypothetical protein